MKETDGFEPAIRELRAAIREHLDGTRDKVADLAFAIASVSESNAAD